MRYYFLSTQNKMLSHYWNSHTRLTSPPPSPHVSHKHSHDTHINELFFTHTHWWNASILPKRTHLKCSHTWLKCSHTWLKCAHSTGPLKRLLARMHEWNALSHSEALCRRWNALTHDIPFAHRTTEPLSHPTEIHRIVFFSLANKTLSEPTPLTHTTEMLSYTPLKGSHTTELFFSTHTQQKHSSETRTVLDFFFFRWQTVKTFASHKHVIYFFAHTRHENNKKTRLKHAHVSELRESISAAWWDFTVRPASPSVLASKSVKCWPIAVYILPCIFFFSPQTTRKSST